MVQVKNFLINYRRRFNLDEILQEWEAEHGGAAEGSCGAEEDKMDGKEILQAEEEDQKRVRDGSSLFSLLILLLHRFLNSC